MSTTTLVVAYYRIYDKKAYSLP